jgi:glucose/arabinose dehydrogenase
MTLILFQENAARNQTADDTLSGQDAFGDWTTDAPGVRRLITVADMPAPHSTPSSDNGPNLVARPENAWPRVPDGFEVTLLAEGLNNPRKIVTAPNGDLFVAESQTGRVRVIRLDENGQTAETEVFADGFQLPFGIAFYPPGPEPEFVYVANTGSVVRLPYRDGDLKARGEPEVVVAELSGGGRLRGGGHWTRDIEFTPDGSKMFVSVGSRSNNDDNAEEKNRACILEYNPDGTGYRIYASGIRNAVGLAIEPETGVLWASVNERDGLGDDLPFEYITHIDEGGFYGWPWYYIGDHLDPAHRDRHPGRGDTVIVPDVLVQAHSASLCMTFYTGDQFPERYSGWAFAAEHGSWNRSRRTGYKVIGVPMVDGKATGEYEDFMTGFVTENGDVWGRPVGVAVDASGALIVTDDGGNCIWRVHYSGEAP